MNLFSKIKNIFKNNNENYIPMFDIKLHWSELREFLHKNPNFTGILHVGENPPANKRIIYYKNGKFHRLDGPAVEYYYNSYRKEYYINGKFISYDEQDFYNSKQYKQHKLFESLTIINCRSKHIQL